MSDFILMHGPALDGSGVVKEQEVHKNNVSAFKAAGWKEGCNPDKPAMVESETCFTAEEMPEPKKKKGRK